MGSDTPTWAPGDCITLRYVGHALRDRGRNEAGLLQGWPYVVVQDTPSLLALWMPVGTHMKLIDMADRKRVLPDLVHGAHPYDPMRRGEVLRLMPPGRSYSIWLHWSPDAERRFLGWYVNLEAPFVRTAIGVDTTDDSLDVIVTPDFEWRWKDEDLTEGWIEHGVYTRAEMDRIRATGLGIVADIEARRFPFDGAWIDWHPVPVWQVPEVTPGWENRPGYDLALSTGRRVTNLDRL